MTLLHGKGAMVWRLAGWQSGDPARQVAEARDLGLRWVSIKIVDGNRLRWEGGVSNPDLLPAAVAALRQAGIEVHGWGWCRRVETIYDWDKKMPTACTPTKEASAAIEVCRKYGIRHFQVNAEASYVGHPEAAEAYCLVLNRDAPDIEYSLCSYRYPLTVQTTFPASIFAPQMDGWCPQVYFLLDNRDDGGAIQMAESLRQHTIIRDIPYTPVAPTYPYGKQKWTARGLQLTRLFERAKALGCEGVSVWDLPQATDEQKAALRDFVMEDEMTRVVTVDDLNSAISLASTPGEVGVLLAEKDYDCINPPPAGPPPAPTKFALIWPTVAPEVVTQAYGIHPEWYNRFGLPGHEGLDLRALTASQIFAAAKGRVSRVQAVVDGGAYGIHVRIEHTHGADVYESVYGHFQKTLVALNQEVMAGEVIGLADNTGNSSGSHLHFTLKHRGHGSPWMNKSDIVNPTPYFPSLFPGKGWSVEAASNLRTGPVLTDPVIRLLSAGTIVKAIDFGGEGGDWWKVEVGGIVGWVWNPGYKLRALA